MLCRNLKAPNVYVCCVEEKAERVLSMPRSSLLILPFAPYKRSLLALPPSLVALPFPGFPSFVGCWCVKRGEGQKSPSYIALPFSPPPWLSFPHIFSWPQIKRKEEEKEGGKNLAVHFFLAGGGREGVGNGPWINGSWKKEKRRKEGGGEQLASCEEEEGDEAIFPQSDLSSLAWLELHSYLQRRGEKK